MGINLVRSATEVRTYTPTRRIWTSRSAALHHHWDFCSTLEFTPVFLVGHQLYLLVIYTPTFLGMKHKTWHQLESLCCGNFVFLARDLDVALAQQHTRNATRAGRAFDKKTDDEFKGSGGTAA
jgi:hypothetical protein